MTEQLDLWDPPSTRTRPARARFRPIHYLGCKLRLLDAIAAVLDELDPARGPVIDLFSGSGVVAADLGYQRDVVAVDIQEYSRVLASALLKPAGLPSDRVHRVAREARELESVLLGTRLGQLVEHEDACHDALRSGDAEPLSHLLEHGSIAAFRAAQDGSTDTLAHAQRAAITALASTDSKLAVTHLFGGVYFSYRQALQLDSLLSAIRALPIDAVDTAIAAAMSAASECVTSVGGHFAQPVRPRDREGRPKVRALMAVADRREIDIYEVFERRLSRFLTLPARTHHGTAVRADYRDFFSSFEGAASTIYADPPYTRDHYSRFYHVLETMALGDMPSVSTVRIGGETLPSRGLYRPGRHQSPFCIRSQAPSAFADLFAGARRLGVPLLLSYSPYTRGTAARPQPRLLTLAEIADLARAVFGRVTVRSAGRLSHSKFNAVHLNGDAPAEAEAFIICEP